MRLISSSVREPLSGTTGYFLCSTANWALSQYVLRKRRAPPSSFKTGALATPSCSSETLQAIGGCSERHALRFTERRAQIKHLSSVRRILSSLNIIGSFGIGSTWVDKSFSVYYISRLEDKCSTSILNTWWLLYINWESSGTTWY